MYNEEEIKRVRQRCVVWTVLALLHAVYGIYYFVSDPADVLAMAVLVPLIVPSLPFLGYFFLGMLFWSCAKMAYDDLEQLSN